MVLAIYPDSKIHRANMGPDGPHDGNVGNQHV